MSYNFKKAEQVVKQLDELIEEFGPDQALTLGQLRGILLEWLDERRDRPMKDDELMDQWEIERQRSIHSCDPADKLQHWLEEQYPVASKSQDD